MCGIVGYIGYRQAAEILMDGLARLEYRGYDSAGIAVRGADGIAIEKTAGRLSVLRQRLDRHTVPSGVCGIGHTRWATHGEPNEVNAHPHRSGPVTLVHNGIIENHGELRDFLLRHGVALAGDTDTECVAGLMAYYHRGDPRETVPRACAMLRGSYALALMFDDAPDRLFAVRHESPLIVGAGEGENFIASDIPAILPYTKTYYLPDEGELCEITGDAVRFFGLGGDELTKQPMVADWEVDAAEKGGFDHFMLKEIYEEPAALRNTVRARAEGGVQALFEQELAAVGHPGRLYIVACGSALHAGLIGKNAVERYARMPVSVEIASEFRYNNPILQPGDAVVLISQSGETADTVAALRHAKSRGIPTLGIVNVIGSTVAREADAVIYTMAGPEIAVATTKAYLCQTAVLLLLAVKLAYRAGTMSQAEAERLLEEFSALPAKIEGVLRDAETVKRLAAVYSGCRDFFFIGRGRDREICAEASLKLKEISYVHSEAYAAGELKHGTISLIAPGTPVAGILTEQELEPKTAANLREVKTRGARVMLVRAEGAGAVPEYCDELLEVPKTDPLLMPLTTIVPLQLFAYYMAVARGCDVDKPRNLAKSVTVE